MEIFLKTKLFGANFMKIVLWTRMLHTYHKLWTEICEIRQNFKWDLIKFCEIFIKITLELSKSSQKPVFVCKKLVINTIKCGLCLFLHKMCCKMVWKFCEIWKSYGNWLLDGPNSVRFYLTVWDMACMKLLKIENFEMPSWEPANQWVCDVIENTDFFNKA